MSVLPRIVWLPGNLRTDIHLDSQATAGSLCLLVDHPPPGWSLPPHRHRNESESVLVVEGRFDMDVEGTKTTLGPGQSIHIPAGTLHAGGNIGETTGQRLIVFSPGGVEGFFYECGTDEPGEPADPGAVLAAAQRYGWDFADLDARSRKAH